MASLAALHTRMTLSEREMGMFHLMFKMAWKYIAYPERFYDSNTPSKDGVEPVLIGLTMNHLKKKYSTSEELSPGL